MPITSPSSRSLRLIAPLPLNLLTLRQTAYILGNHSPGQPELILIEQLDLSTLKAALVC